MARHVGAVRVAFRDAGLADAGKSFRCKAFGSLGSSLPFR